MRLAITLVEAYRLYRDGDWMSLEDLESRIRGDEERTEAMVRGSAFHRIVEYPERCREPLYDSHKAHGWTFFGVSPVLEMMPEGRVNEAKATADVGGITLVGKADALHGLDVYEAKCTKRVQVDRYMESFQWRAYLYAFGVDRCTYVLAEFKDNGEQQVVIRNVTPLPLYRYPRLERDVQSLVEECAEFIESRGLSEYVEDKHHAA